MKKQIKDGWHTLAGYSVYVENGYVLRGVAPDYNGIGERSIYPYEHSKYGGLDKAINCLASTFTARVKRGTLIMN